jgi:hypothetical protein
VNAYYEGTMPAALNAVVIALSNVCQIDIRTACEVSQTKFEDQSEAQKICVLFGNYYGLTSTEALAAWLMFPPASMAQA